MRHAQLVALWAVAMLLTTNAFGQATHTWTGAGTNDLFSNSENWVGAAPGTNLGAGSFIFGEEDGTAPNYNIQIDAGGGQSRQIAGRFTFTNQAQPYTVTGLTEARNLRVLGVNAASDPREFLGTGDFLAIDNQSGYLQTFKLKIDSSAPSGNTGMLRQVWNSGNGGLAFEQQVLFGSNAKDLRLVGAGDFTFGTAAAPTAIILYNTTGSAAALQIDGPGTTTVHGVIDSLAIRVNGGTLLLAGNDPLDPSFNLITGKTGLGLAGGTLAFDDDGISRRASLSGSLTLTGDSVIRLGDSSSGASRLEFLGTDSTLGSHTIIIENWNGTPYSGGGNDQIIFGAIDSFDSLLNNTTDQIKFRTAGGSLLDARFVQQGAYLEVIPIPEPAAIAVGLGLLFVGGWRERGRFFRSVLWVRARMDT